MDVLCRYDLDDWHDATPDEIGDAARRAATTLGLTIGVATRPVPKRLTTLLDMLTVTLARDGLDDQRVVALDDPEDGFAQIAASARRRPQTCVALEQLLRQTPRLDTLGGLAAEAAVYSMLLDGGEFATWLSERGTPRPAEAPVRPLVLVARDDGRLSITLDHPERRNAFSFTMREALYEALEVATVDDTLTDIEIDGAGPVFCSGGDLAEFGTATDRVAAYLVRLDRAPWRLIDRLAERVTVRVHGAVVGAGIELAAFAGNVIAAPGTFLLLPELEMGLVPGAGGTVSIPRRIGRWRTAWMVLSGQRIDAGTALSWGLVDAIGEP